MLAVIFLAAATTATVTPTPNTTATPAVTPSATPWGQRRPPRPVVVPLSEPTPMPSSPSLSDLGSQIKLNREGSGSAKITNRTLEVQKPTKHPATKALYFDLMQPVVSTLKANMDRFSGDLQRMAKGLYRGDAEIFQMRMSTIGAAFRDVEVTALDIEPPPGFGPTHAAFVGCVRQLIMVTGRVATFGLEPTQTAGEEALLAGEETVEKCQAVRRTLEAPDR